MIEGLRHPASPGRHWAIIAPLDPRALPYTAGARRGGNVCGAGADPGPDRRARSLRRPDVFTASMNEEDFPAAWWSGRSPTRGIFSTRSRPGW